MSRMMMEAHPPRSAAPASSPAKAAPSRLLSTAIQAKLAVWRADDSFEQEADRVADHVLRVPEPTLQRQCAGNRAAQLDRRGGYDVVPTIRRRAEGGSGDVGAADSLVSALGAGRPLEPGVRSYFEPRLRADFSNVRVHNGATADVAARSVDALAFTYGANVVFRSGQYAPAGDAGRRLLAHELAHVVQQRGSGARIQRQAACPSRASGEVARSRAPGGVLAGDVIFAPLAHRLDIVDFAIDSAVLPAGVTTTPEWQRAMSLIVGDPSIRLGVEGFTDCVGSDAENLDLRERRGQAVIAQMPPAAQAKVLFAFTVSSTTFLDTNATEEGRAGNRAVRISFRATPMPGGQDPCDMVGRAGNLDQYLFLVRCLENKLSLTSPAQAPTALSVLRQIYYGTSSWSRTENIGWRYVIPVRPWAPGTDPTPTLGTALMTALGQSQVVEGVDIGHILTGIDAMMNPVAVVDFPASVQIPLPNEEWATWAGDVGSAAADWAWDAFLVRANMPPPLDYFQRLASDADLVGDLDSFALRAGGSAATPPAQLGQTIALAGRLSETLLQYFRITSSARGVARSNRVRTFVQSYGGVIAGKALTNRPAFVQRLRPSVAEFARLISLQRLLSPTSGSPPPGHPDLSTVRALGVAAMTELFVRWLEARL